MLNNYLHLPSDLPPICCLPITAPQHHLWSAALFALQAGTSLVMAAITLHQLCLKNSVRLCKWVRPFFSLWLPEKFYFCICGRSGKRWCMIQLLQAIYTIVGRLHLITISIKLPHQLVLDNYTWYVSRGVSVVVAVRL